MTDPIVYKKGDLVEYIGDAPAPTELYQRLCVAAGRKPLTRGDLGIVIDTVPNVIDTTTNGRVRKNLQVHFIRASKKWCMSENRLKKVNK